MRIRQARFVLAADVAGTHVCVVHTDGTLECAGTDNNGCVSGPSSQPGNPNDPDNRYIDVTTGGNTYGFQGLNTIGALPVP